MPLQLCILERWLGLSKTYVGCAEHCPPLPVILKPSHSVPHMHIYRARPPPFGRLFRFLRLSVDELRGLEEAARREALADASEGEFCPPATNDKIKALTKGQPVRTQGRSLCFNRLRALRAGFSPPNSAPAVHPASAPQRQTR